MADILKIPLSSENASFKLRVEIEKKSYIFRFDWNDRMKRWILGIFDAEEAVIYQSFPLNIDTSMLTIYTKQELPAGEMVLYDTSEEHQECSRHDLGQRCVLLYENSVS